jgi:hypothetical protein
VVADRVEFLANDDWGLHMRRVGMIVALTALVSGTASAGFAGPLLAHPDAFGGVTGSVAFDNGLGLSGAIDYAVFTADDFNANFAGLGYVPGASLVYTYQLVVDGSLGITKFTVGLGNPANTIGSFDLGGQAPSVSQFDCCPEGAQWVFGTPVAGGTTSWGLAYSSPNTPFVGFAEVFAESSSTVVGGVPTPSDIFFVPVPEPSSLLLVGSGVLFFVGTRRR